MDRRLFLQSAGAAAMVAAPATPPTQQTPPEYGEVRLTSGLLHDRFELNARRTFSVPPADILMPFFRAKGLSNGGRELNEGFPQRRQSVVWPGLYSGFWLSGASHIARWSGNPEHKMTLTSMVHEIAKTREPDGFLLAMGRDASKRWSHYDLYALVRVTVRAMLDAYEVTGEQLALDLARGQMDCMIRDIVSPPGRGSGILLRGADAVRPTNTHYKLLPAFAQLYRHTRDSKYLEVAERCLDLPFMDAMLEGKKDLLPGRHASTWVDYLLGVYQIGKLTGNAQYTEFVLKTADRIRRHHLFPTGSMSSNEEWRSGEQGWQLQESNRAQETCCAAIWISLLQNLLQGTDDGVHADAVESAAYNALFASQSPATGDFCYFVNLTGNGKPYDNPPEWGRHCCEGTGLMAIGRLPGMIYAKTVDGIAVNLYAGSELQTRVNNVRVRIRQQTSYPFSGRVKIAVDPERPVEFTLTCRVPSWSRAKLQSSFRRTWSPGSTVDLDFGMEPEVITEVFNGVPRAMLRYGPLVFAGEWQDDAPVRKANIPHVIHGSHSHFEQWPSLPSLVVKGAQPPAFRRSAGAALSFSADAVPPADAPGAAATFPIRFVPFCSAFQSKYSVWFPLHRTL